MTPILNATEVAQLLGCSTQTVAEHAKAGRLPGYKFGDGWVFSSDLVVDAVKKMSLDRAKQKPQQTKPVALMLTKSKRKQIPGFSMLTAELQAQLEN
tara:strand:- start:1673 stop:1963 length:291 start_codon:yes stop_codon:yes gene_type:complete